MDRTCIINPRTGRAVKADGAVGRKLMRASTTLTAAAKRKLTEPKTKQKPKQKPPEPFTMYKEPIGPKKPSKPFTMYKEPIGPKKPSKPLKDRKVTGVTVDLVSNQKKIKTDELEKGKLLDVASDFKMQRQAKAAKTLQAAIKRKLTKPPKPKKKIDADYIRRYADYLYNKYTKEELAEKLKKAKNGDEVKDIYSDYIGPLYKAQAVIGAMIDNELTKEEQAELLKIKKIRALYFRSYSNDFFGTKQDYLFKFEEPAE